ncbi:MAG: Abi family protein [Treponema sp.]|nr:Abi family protein [Treponema sp.]
MTAFNDCPAWVLLEFLTFGDFIKFYEFYYKVMKIKMPISIPISTPLFYRCIKNSPKTISNILHSVISRMSSYSWLFVVFI